MSPKTSDTPSSYFYFCVFFYVFFFTKKTLDARTPAIAAALAMSAVADEALAGASAAARGAAAGAAAAVAGAAAGLSHCFCGLLCFFFGKFVLPDLARPQTRKRPEGLRPHTLVD